MRSIPVKAYKRKGPKGKVITVRGYTRGSKKGIRSNKDSGYTGTLHGAKMYVNRTEKGSEKSGVESFDDYNPFLSDFKPGEFDNLPHYPKELFGNHFKGKTSKVSSVNSKKSRMKKGKKSDIWSRVEDKLESFAKRHGENYKRIL